MIKKIFATAILFSAFAVGLVPSAAKEEQAPQAKRNLLPENSESVQIKTDSTGWVDFNGSYAHIDEGNITIDDNSTDAVAGYNSESNTLVIYNAESSNLISGIKAAGDFDFEVSFEKNFDEDHLIAFELDCTNAVLTSSQYKFITVPYILANNLTISGELECRVTFFSDNAAANAFFDQSIDPPHNSIVEVDSFSLIDGASFDGTTINNMSAVSELLAPGNFVFFNLGTMTINTEGFFRAGLKTTSGYPTDYSYKTLYITESNMPDIIKCEQGFDLYGKYTSLTNNVNFNNEINKNYSSPSTYYVGFRQQKLYGTNIYHSSLISNFHSTDIPEDQIILWNANTKKNYSNYHPTGLTYENGVITISQGCTYTNPIEVESPHGKKYDLTVRFEKGNYGWTNIKTFAITNPYGNLTLTTTGDDEATYYAACVCCTGSLTIKGNLNVRAVGIPPYDSDFPHRLDNIFTNPSNICNGIIYGEERVIIEENASIYAVASSDFFGMMSAAARDNTIACVRGNRLIVTSNKSVELGSLYEASSLYRITGLYLNEYTPQRIDNKMLIRNQKNVVGADFKIYRYNNSNRNFFAGRSLSTGYYFENVAQMTGTSYNISVHPSMSTVDVASLTSNSSSDLTNHEITFSSNGGSGSMAAVNGLTAHTFYKLPECEFSAPAYKVFKGWAFTNRHPSIIKQPGELVDIQDKDLDIYPVWEDTPIPALTGTVSITGSLKYNETLTASVTDTNNTGTLSYQWRRNGDDIASATSSTYKVSENDIGYTLSVKVSSSIETGFIVGTASGVISKADGPSAPTGITATACTTEDNNDGVIKGVTTDMEYKLSSLSGWVDGTGSDITGLVPGTYNVRYKETSTHEAGEIANVVVNAYNDPVLYSVTVNKGTANPVSAVAGTTITITADEAEDGYVFDKWVSTDGLVFADANSETTTFSMPEKNVTVTATYKLIPVPELDSITLSGTYKTEFKVGDIFSYDGLVVTAHYTNGGADKVVTGYVVSIPDMSTPGEKTITVTYTENEVTKTATYKINVSEKVVPPEPPVTPTSNGLSGGAIAGIIIASILVAGLGGFSIFWFVIKKKSFADLIAVFKKK